LLQARRCLSPEGKIAVLCEKDDIPSASDILAKQPGMFLHQKFNFAITWYVSDERTQLYQSLMVPILIGVPFQQFSNNQLKKNERDSEAVQAYLCDFLGIVEHTHGNKCEFATFNLFRWNVSVCYTCGIS
jgi:hypothetical protein